MRVPVRPILIAEGLHDANIVATMLARGEQRPLTFHAADFRRYGDRIELADISRGAHLDEKNTSEQRNDPG